MYFADHIVRVATFGVDTVIVHAGYILTARVDPPRYKSRYFII